jgi:hypothetical protein
MYEHTIIMSHVHGVGMFQVTKRNAQEQNVSDEILYYKLMRRQRNIHKS